MTELETISLADLLDELAKRGKAVVAGVVDWNDEITLRTNGSISGQGGLVAVLTNMVGRSLNEWLDDTLKTKETEGEDQTS